MFADRAKIYVRSGKGGDGHVSFRREKYVPAGGPDGGDGGHGGDVIFIVDEGLNTLTDFRHVGKYKAGDGQEGGKKNCRGKDGDDIYIKVPEGTVIKEFNSGKVIADMSGDNRKVVLLKGGRGGNGNQHYATSTMQAPKYAQPGQPAQELELTLELKVIADVGLVGFPNVGKSTLLSVVSKAHPKIANYHFTTLFPNLGVVYVSEGVSFVMADIPGIIEGASEGAGLGHDFLRHIDRCRLLIHLVDVAGSEGRDPIEDFEAINAELRQYSETLADRRMLVVANKCDLLGDDRAPIERLRGHVEAQGYEFFEMSAAAHQGTQELMKAAAALLAELPPVIRYEADYVPPEPSVDTSGELNIEKCDDDYWSVEGPWLQRLLMSVNLGDYESRMYFDRVLREAGVFDRLEQMGVKDGDTIGIYDLEFEYQT